MRKQRAFAIVAAILVLASINLIVISTITATGDDRQTGALRAHSLRAEFAAESALAVAEVTRILGDPFPAGTTNLPAGESYALLNSRNIGGGLTEVRVTGSFGLADATATANLGP